MSEHTNRHGIRYTVGKKPKYRSTTWWNVYCAHPDKGHQVVFFFQRKADAMTFVRKLSDPYNQKSIGIPMVDAVQPWLYDKNWIDGLTFSASHKKGA
jgi:hypothetical protein